jgi:hypothetical protein
LEDGIFPGPADRLVQFPGEKRAYSHTRPFFCQM